MLPRKNGSSFVVRAAESFPKSLSPFRVAIRAKGKFAVGGVFGNDYNEKR